MILDSKPLDDLNENDLQQLIENKTLERKVVEYKRDLPTNSFKDRKEFLADISSFANTSGGYLLYGVEAKDGIPIELYGLEVESVDAIKLRFENMLRDGLSPRVPPLDMHPVNLSSGKIVLVLRIPRSWLLPHRVILENHGQFYGRNSGGHFQMDVSQLRTAFELSGTLGERIRAFRNQRVSLIENDAWLPASLGSSKARWILHLVPFTAFDSDIRYDLMPLMHPDQRQLIEPLSLHVGKPGIRNLCRPRYNFDGLACTVPWGDRSNSYVQFFRNGCIEAADVTLLSTVGKKIPSVSYEYALCAILSRYVQALRLLKVDTPIFILMSILGVKDFTMGYDDYDRYAQGQEHSIDRPSLVIPEIIMDRFDCEPAQALKPIFDTIWNAAGWKGSMNYDASGKSTLPATM